MADPWASVSDVNVVTGVTVTEAQLAQAQSVIELMTGRTADASSLMKARDLHWLKMAVAYEAAWLPDKPDLLTQTDVTSYNQDGATANLKADAQILAPLARRAMKRLSWRGNRSVHTPSSFDRQRARHMPGTEGVVAVMEDTDADDTWKPL